MLLVCGASVPPSWHLLYSRGKSERTSTLLISGSYGSMVAKPSNVKIDRTDGTLRWFPTTASRAVWVLSVLISASVSCAGAAKRTIGGTPLHASQIRRSGS